MARIATVVYPKAMDSQESMDMFAYLRDNMKWGEGVKSKYSKVPGESRGFTRLACQMQFGQDELLDTFIMQAISLVKLPDNISHLGMYLNYQRDGMDWTPNHNHPKQCQVVINTGPATRTFTVGKKSYKVANGDVIVFGSSVHGVPQEPEVKEPRISIATFTLCLDKVSNLDTDEDLKELAASLSQLVAGQQVQLDIPSTLALPAKPLPPPPGTKSVKPLPAGTKSAKPLPPETKSKAKTTKPAGAPSAKKKATSRIPESALRKIAPDHPGPPGGPSVEAKTSEEPPAQLIKVSQLAPLALPGALGKAPVQDQPKKSRLVVVRSS